jgi:hypothetical protein
VISIASNMKLPLRTCAYGLLYAQLYSRPLPCRAQPSNKTSGVELLPACSRSTW